MVSGPRSLKLCCWMCVATLLAAASFPVAFFYAGVARGADPAPPAEAKPQSKPADEAKKPASKEAASTKAESKEADEPEFVRVTRDDDGRPKALQTAIVRYEKPGAEGQPPEWTVDLVGAIHVGDKAYYRRLNRRFKEYDALLYELVAPEEQRVPERSRGNSHPIGMLQGGMSDILGLVHQLDYIDYKQPNFVHADMSPDEFAKSMKDRGESFLTMMFRAMGYSIAEQSRNPNAISDLEILAALFARNRPLALKRVVSRQMGEVDGMIGMFDGPDGSTIITERNKVALDVLRKQVAAGKTHLGVFYGAGHLPDMDKRLLEDFGLKRGEVVWVTAWDLRDPVETPDDAPKDAAKSSKKPAEPVK